METWGHRKLWAAVLVRAIIDSKMHCCGNVNRERIRNSAIFWLYKSKGRGPGSFMWACEALGLSVEFVRDYVRGWDGIKFDSFNYLL